MGGRRTLGTHFSTGLDQSTYPLEE